MVKLKGIMLALLSVYTCMVWANIKSERNIPIEVRAITGIGYVLGAAAVDQNGKFYDSVSLPVWTSHLFTVAKGDYICVMPIGTMNFTTAAMYKVTSSENAQVSAWGTVNFPAYSASNTLKPEPKGSKWKTLCANHFYY